MSMRAALVLAVLLVVGGAALGAAGARFAVRTAPAAAPSPPPATVRPTAAPTEDASALVFRQPLTAGCATDTGVWVVSDGGGIARFGEDQWVLVDGTLRSLVGAACAKTELIAVGPAGRVVSVNDAARTIRPDATGLEDLIAAALLPDGAGLAVGTHGTVLRREAGWTTFALGIEEDLLGVSFTGTSASAWIVGDGGAAYRLEDRGWRSLPTGVSAALRAVAASAPDDALAVGDDGAIVRWRGSWTKIASNVTAPLRAVARSGGAAYVAGDGGTALRIDLGAGSVTRIELGTSCPVRSVFVQGADAWFVASDGATSAVWRRSGERLQKWGSC